MAVIRAARETRYDLEIIAIDRRGAWSRLDGPQDVLDPDHPGKARVAQGAGVPVAPVPGSRRLVLLDGPHRGDTFELDVAFPVLHGPGGEDGTIQGVFELMDLPYVGADVLGSSVAMDKDVMKRLAADAGLVITPHLVVRGRHWDMDPGATVENVTAWCQHRGFPVYVKPANLGSSVGISRVITTKGIRDALLEAFHFDRKVVVERGVEGREIECAVLGGDEPDAARHLGEVVPRKADFYSYDAKYMDGQGADTIVPADVEDTLVARVRALGVRAFRALECWGMARVDFFIERETDRILFNEINTIPGFTAISMYAKMWEASGVAYPDLIDRLVDLAVGRHSARPSPAP